MTMTPQQRAQTALAHQEPDRVPVDFWSTQAMDEKLLAELGLADREELLGEFGVDLRYIEGPRYIGPPLEVEPDGIEYDLWGVPRKKTVIAREGLR